MEPIIREALLQQAAAVPEEPQPKKRRGVREGQGRPNGVPRVPFMLDLVYVWGICQGLLGLNSFLPTNLGFPLNH